MKRFSQRKGFKPSVEVIQAECMNDSLRNSLWNALDIALWSTDDYLYRQYGKPHIEPFSRALWFSFFKIPIDSRPEYGRDILKEIRQYFFGCQWFEVYDFLEFVIEHYESTKPNLAGLMNRILERELSAYRFVGGNLTDITGTQELEMLNDALGDDRFAGVTAHLQRALELYSNRENPDYRNSIKESISAVESIARIVAANSNATLTDALKAIEKRGSLHPALRDGFIKLYGYSSDEDGIRHAMLDEPNLTAADARYFLLSCTSFVNYLKEQLD